MSDETIHDALYDHAKRINAAIDALETSIHHEGRKQIAARFMDGYQKNGWPPEQSAEWAVRDLKVLERELLKSR